MKTYGTLYLVGVPIGNDGDITLRAIETLKAVDAIAAEDTRKCQRLFTSHGIKPQKLVAHHDQNEKASANGLVKWLQDGQSVAYISDAGMPCVSDPGFVLVKTAREAGCMVEVIPGVSASITALAASGLSPAGFTFVGFPSRKTGERKKQFETLKSREETLVFYESPRRVVTTLADMVAVFGETREAFAGRELTKIHQEQIAMPLKQLHAYFAAKDEVLGEFVIVVAGAEAGAVNAENVIDLDARIHQLAAEGLRAKEISAQLAQELGVSKRDIYQKVLETLK